MGLLKRYLIYFSYIGTNFRGVQRQKSRTEVNYHDPSTVQGLLEYALERMKPLNKVAVELASRTDQGVHALNSAAAINLDFNYEIKPIRMHHFLNRFFHDTELPIRVQNIVQVPWDFSPRKLPLWRKYIYRFAILKDNSLLDKDNEYTIPIPITEYNRCYFVMNSIFNIDEVRKTCDLFIGTKDFISFMGKPKHQPEDISTIRCIHSLIIESAQPYLPSKLNDNFSYYHLICEGKSFVYNQIRRTVAILLAVGQGILTFHDVELMFTDPTPINFDKFKLAPAYGLYLADIFYNPKDVALPNDIKITEEKELDPAEIMKQKKEMIKARLEILQVKREKYSNKM